MPFNTHRVPSFDTLSSVLPAVSESLALTVKDTYAIPKIIKRILKWAGDDPELTQIICDYVLQRAAAFDDSNAEDLVDQIVETQIIDQWSRSQVASHINAIVSTLLDGDRTTFPKENRKDLLLLSYLKILQRGSVAMNDESLEHTKLLRSGLVTCVDGRLMVSNPLYARIFDLAWIEQQLPGITRPVRIIEPDATPVQLETVPDSRKPSAASGFYSKLAVLACCFAVAGTALSAYRHEMATSRAIATQAENSAGSFQAASANDLIVAGDVPSMVTKGASGAASTEESSTSPSIAAENSAPLAAPVSNRDRFDKGVEHATNSRWLPMVREFCQLPADSTYYITAKRQLESWVGLYREDLQIAQDAFMQEESGTCEMLTDALE